MLLENDTAASRLAAGFQAFVSIRECVRTLRAKAFHLVQSFAEMAVSMLTSAGRNVQRPAQSVNELVCTRYF